MAGRVRKALVAAVAAALLVAVASVAGAESGQSVGAKADPNGILRYARDLPNTFGDNFNPGTLNNDCSYAVTNLIFESVTKDGSNTEISGGVAESWEVSPDSLTVTLHLRADNGFSDGTPVDGEAVKASLLNTKKSPQRTSLFAIDTIDVPDPLTVVLHLATPVAGDLLWAFSYIDGQIVSPSSLADAEEHPIGSGPFLLTGFEAGQSITLEVNETYHDAKKYKLHGVEFVQVGQGPQAVTALKSDEVDMIDLRPEDFPAVKADPSLGISVTPSLDYSLIQLRQDTAPFDNEEVRAALEFAVDRKAINKVVYNNQNEIADQPFPKVSAAHNKSIEGDYSYKPKKAKAMLEAAGFPDGVSFDMVMPAGAPTFERMAPLLKNQMAKAGFDATIIPVAGGEYFSEVFGKKTGQAVLSLALTNGPASWNNFQSNYSQTGFVANAFGSVRPDIEELVVDARTTIDDPEGSGELMQQAGALVMEKGYEVPLVFEQSMVAYSKDRVGGPPKAPIGACRSNLEGVFIKK
ncbi:MAG: ABC transporter substrate-binding protein [Acidimicrobiia bacterium]|nr:ABC transporter substrate-binding protein [Acidimicrobiia bacterium]